MISPSSCSVSENMPLYDILNEFQKGHSHIAVVYSDVNENKEAPVKIKEGEQLDFKDSCKNGKNTPLGKGRDLNKTITNFILLRLETMVFEISSMVSYWLNS